jgi:hypothetical protein
MDPPPLNLALYAIIALRKRTWISLVRSWPKYLVWPDAAHSMTTDTLFVGSEPLIPQRKTLPCVGAEDLPEGYGNVEVSIPSKHHNIVVLGLRAEQI